MVVPLDQLLQEALVFLAKEVVMKQLLILEEVEE